MVMADRVGLDVAKVSFEEVVGMDVLLVERFDRYFDTSGWCRPSLVSALTCTGP